MYCYRRDKTRLYWKPLHITSRKAKDFLLNPKNPVSNFKWARSLGAVYEIIHRWTRPNRRPEFDIPDVHIQEKPYSIIEKNVLEKPFCSLKLFEKQGFSEHQPTLLVVAPLSGHYATLVRDTIHTLLVDYLRDFHQLLGENVHVLAVCQPCVPVLMATASLAQESSPYQPKSMILMGGPIDTRINPTAVNTLASTVSLSWFEKNMVSSLPSYAPGAGRKVAPGNLILGGFIEMNAWSHIKKHAEHIINVTKNNEPASNTHRKFYDEYLSVMDLPAEYFLQTVDKVFQRHLIPKNQMDYRGIPLNFNKICATALMTIEGENDDITGLGQTYAAHTLCSNIPKSKRHHFVKLDVGHYGIFSGSRWRKDIYPKIRDFIKMLDS